MKLNFDNDLTVRKLFIFCTYMESENLARTAETLGISTVSVHRALHTLEESLRCPLFTHKGRNLVALPAAWTLLEYSNEALLTLSQGLEETRRTAGIGLGHLRIGTLYSLSLDTVPRLIMNMKLRRPELELNLTMGSNQVLTGMLQNNQLDAMIISVTETEIDQKVFEQVGLFQDDIYLAVPTAEQRDSAEDVDLRDYSDKPFVSLDEGFATFTGFQEACHVAGFEPNIVTRVNDIFSMLSLVQAGMGYSLVPGRMRKQYEHDLQFLKLAEPYQMRQQIAIVFARNREHDPNLLALVAEGRMYALSLQNKAQRTSS
jgi:LysR family transcriptional regulator, malonate utilization transcriptional regulator